jgi:CRISPR system Cascade subunit CasC
MNQSKALVEFHILQNYAPSNLNRDDSGSPKDAVFGQAVRGRISSQCLKRAMRTYVAEHDLLSPDVRGVRTTRVVDAIASRLESQGRNIDAARQAAATALASVKLKFEDNRSQYLLFLGHGEINRIADIINSHWDVLVSASGAEEAPKEGGKKSAKQSKQDAKDKLPKEVGIEISAALDGGRAVDIALFGRMVADSPDISRDAACQIAHALSTHRIEREFDFFTAVDDLQSNDDSGAGMLGTVEFSSACYYRYGVIDLRMLADNLGGDMDLALEGLRAFLDAAVHARPSGKQNTFAAHQAPGYVGFSVRTKGVPHSLANAFETPVRAAAGTSVTAQSVEQLKNYRAKLVAAYGLADSLDDLDLTGGEIPAQTLDALIASTVDKARAALGGQ